MSHQLAENLFRPLTGKGIFSVNKRRLFIKLQGGESSNQGESKNDITTIIRIIYHVVDFAFIDGFFNEPLRANACENDFLSGSELVARRQTVKFHLYERRRDGCLQDEAGRVAGD